MPPAFWTLVCAELAFVLARSADIQVVLKTAKQCTVREVERIENGLARNLLVEALIMVPASAILAVQLAPLLPWEKLGGPTSDVTHFSLLGVISYGFPFVAIKKVTVRLALSALRDYAAVAQVSPAELDEKSPPDVRPQDPPPASATVTATRKTGARM